MSEDYFDPAAVDTVEKLEKWIADQKSRGPLAEGPNWEFKSDRIAGPKLDKEIAAFANTDGGVIVFGVSDDGTVTGFKDDRESFTDWFNSKFRRSDSAEFFPALHLPRIVPISGEDGRRVYYVIVDPSDVAPHLCRGARGQNAFVIYGRIGSLAERLKIEDVHARFLTDRIRRFRMRGLIASVRTLETRLEKIVFDETSHGAIKNEVLEADFARAISHELDEIKARLLNGMDRGPYGFEGHVHGSEELNHLQLQCLGNLYAFFPSIAASCKDIRAQVERVAVEVEKGFDAQHLVELAVEAVRLAEEIDEQRSQFFEVRKDILAIESPHVESLSLTERFRRYDKVRDAVPILAQLLQSKEIILDHYREARFRIEELLETTKVATLGQISRALYDVGGQYRRNM